MRFVERDINELGDLFRHLRADATTYPGPLWYRGQANAAWNLEPKMLRPANPNHPPEQHIINRFKQSAAYLLASKPITDFDWLFLMQHHGMPTRLLDWSEGPLIALYFAVNEHPDADGALWVLAPCELNKRAGYRPEWEYEIPSFEDEALSSYSPSKLASERRSSLQPMAAIAVRNSPRIHAQQGVFTVSHRENIRLDLITAQPEESHYWKFNIPMGSKARIISELKLAGVGRFQLFPELSSISIG